MVVVTGTANDGNDANLVTLTRRWAQCVAGVYESLDATSVAIGNVADVNEKMDHRIDNTSEPQAIGRHLDYVIQGETKWQNERVMGAARERSSGTE